MPGHVLPVAFLGDVVGSPGRRAFGAAAAALRARSAATVFIVNGENSRHGSGISPENYRELRKAGAHAVTLGDHCYKDRNILPVLAEESEPISRPANLSLRAPGKRLIRLTPQGSPPLYVLTVLGRVFMPIPTDSPFDVLDREIAAVPEADAMFIVEVHGEVTSEKQALAWHCLNRWTRDDRARVVAVVGTHTHVQTADARLLDHQLAAMTDLGMCGPHRSVIGRSIAATLDAMTCQAPVPLDVATDDVRALGCLITVDTRLRRATAIEAIDIPAPG